MEQECSSGATEASPKRAASDLDEQDGIDARNIISGKRRRKPTERLVDMDEWQQQYSALVLDDVPDDEIQAALEDENFDSEDEAFSDDEDEDEDEDEDDDHNEEGGEDIDFVEQVSDEDPDAEYDSADDSVDEQDLDSDAD